MVAALEHAAWSDPDILPHGAAWANVRGGIDLGGRRHGRGGMHAAREVGFGKEQRQDAGEGNRVARIVN